MLSGKAIREKRKALKLTVDELAAEIGVSPANLYKWEKGHRPANPEDYLKLEGWLKSGVETVPKEKLESVPKKSHYSDLGAQGGADLEMTSLPGLIRINENLSSAQLIDAQSRKELIRQNEMLVKMLEDERAINSSVQKEIQLSQLAGFSDILVQLAQIGVKAGFYKSLEEAVGILSIPLESLAKSVTGKKQISRSAGKRA